MVNTVYDYLHCIISFFFSCSHWCHRIREGNVITQSVLINTSNRVRVPTSQIIYCKYRVREELYVQYNFTCSLTLENIISQGECQMFHLLSFFLVCLFLPDIKICLMRLFLLSLKSNQTA